jgi:hypothetical protein
LKKVAPNRECALRCIAGSARDGRRDFFAATHDGLRVSGLAADQSALIVDVRGRTAAQRAFPGGGLVRLPAGVYRAEIHPNAAPIRFVVAR